MNNILKKNIKNDRKAVNILGVDVLSTNETEVLAGITQKISHNEKFSIFTPNPELILLADKNRTLKEVLNNADYLIPDGVGLKYASGLLYGKSLSIIPGRILFEKLIGIADKHGWKVFFLGGKDNESQKASEVLRKKYKNIKIDTFGGPILDNKGQPATDLDTSLQKDAVDRVNKFGPQIVFVAFGNPKQEFWINQNIKSLKTNGIMAIGGTFRYISGMSKLPPQWVSKAGFEWMWRFISEPVRILRIFDAVIVFPVKIIGAKFGVK
jgi:N-acetylglucosaminyldiphosphoundecaprenol N-acetyl-beta-D-mannosaminyltransferase